MLPRYVIFTLFHYHYQTKTVRAATATAANDTIEPPLVRREASDVLPEPFP